MSYDPDLQAQIDRAASDDKDRVEWDVTNQQSSRDLAKSVAEAKAGAEEARQESLSALNFLNPPEEPEPTPNVPLPSNDALPSEENEQFRSLDTKKKFGLSYPVIVWAVIVVVLICTPNRFAGGGFVTSALLIGFGCLIAGKRGRPFGALLFVIFFVISLLQGLFGHNHH